MANCSPDCMIFRFLSDTGLPGGVVNIVANYSATPTHFYYTAPTGKVVQIERMIMLLQDLSGLNGNVYAGLASALTNGITLKVKSGGPTGTEILNLTELPIKINSHWKGYCHDVEPIAFVSPPQTDAMSARWTFSKSGTPLFLDGDNQDTIVLTVQDNFTGIEIHRYQVQGVIL